MRDGSTSVWQKAHLSDSTTSKLKSFSFVLKFNTVHFELKFLKFGFYRYTLGKIASKLFSNQQLMPDPLSRWRMINGGLR